MIRQTLPEADKVIFKSDRSFCLKLWLGVFLYTSLAAVIVQFIVLGYFAPESWGVHHGQLSPDSKMYHFNALDLAEKISLKGWTSWELRPTIQAQAIGGIVAILYYLFIPEPWVVIPLNAFLHATSSLLIFLIIQIITENRRYALVSAGMVALFPSTASWFSQLSKEGCLVAGFLLFLFSVIALSDSFRRPPKWHQMFSYPVMLMAGVSLAWLVRPYYVAIFQFLGGFCLAAVTLKFVSNRKIVGSSFRILTLVMMFVSLFSLGKLFPQPVFSGFQSSKEKLIETSTDAEKLAESRQGKTIATHASEKIKKNILDRYFDDIFRFRNGFQNIVLKEAASNIDYDVKIEGFKGVMMYLPRAAQIAFLAPFPVHWIGQGSLPENTVMRRVVLFEMVWVYVCLMFLPYACWVWRDSWELWVLFLGCVPILMLLGVVVTNFGTLYRMRFGFFMPIVSIGAAGLLELRHWRLKS